MATQHKYESSVLRCNIDEDGCAVCEFLNGSHSLVHLMETIRILDATLARAEEHARTLEASMLIRASDG